VEGTAVSGELRADLAGRWGMPAELPVAGGAGDVAAAAVGLGAVSDGDSFASIGTSAQLLVVAAAHRPAPATLVHAFAHAVPDRWFQMGAMLNGASCLSFAANLFGTDPATLVREAEGAFGKPSPVVFLPYLAGERTPHNDPNAKGVFFGLTPTTDRAALALAVLEGVAYSYADALAAIEAAGTRIERPFFVGGGAQSRLWARILANVMNRPLVRVQAADKGPAFGAARLARLAATGERAEAVCVAPAVLDVSEPESDLVEAYAPKVARFRRLYIALREEFGR
jgi:xylulokinase